MIRDKILTSAQEYTWYRVSHTIPRYRRLTCRARAMETRDVNILDLIIHQGLVDNDVYDLYPSLPKQNRRMNSNFLFCFSVWKSCWGILCQSVKKRRQQNEKKNEIGLVLSGFIHPLWWFFQVKSYNTDGYYLVLPYSTHTCPHTASKTVH